MKRIILTAIAVIGVFSSFTSRTDPDGKKALPQNIAPSFAAKYPNAKIKKWEMRNEQYIVDFTDDRNKCAAYYSPGGGWIKTEVSIPWTKDLPMAVRKSVQNSGYGQWRVDGIKEVMTAGQPLYVLHVDDGDSLDSDHYDAFKKDYMLSFTADGILKDKEKILN